MRDFYLDEEVIQTKANMAREKITNTVWNLIQAEKIIEKAIDEIDKHSELAGLAYTPMRREFEKLREVAQDYNEFGNLVYEYYDAVDSHFYREEEKILERLGQLKVEDFKVPNTLGITEEVTIYNQGIQHKYNIVKSKIGFEDLLSYGTVSEVMQTQYDGFKELCKEQGVEYNEEVTDYIKMIVENGQFDYEVGWKKGTSLLIDIIPVVGDAKAIIECIVGEDLITGRKLNGLERGLCAISVIPFVGDGMKIGGKLAKEGLGEATKILAKETAVNAVSYGASLAMEEAGVNPLVALACYQGGRITYSKGKNLAKGIRNISDEIDNVKRYNKYWKDVASGRYDIPYGMTKEEYSNYLKGIDKVQYGKVLKNVNYEEILDIRKNDTFTQWINNAEVNKTTAMKEEILKNVEESRIAREASGYKNFIEFESGLTKGVSKATDYGKYSTIIDDKVKVIDKVDLPEWIGESFTDGNYRTVVTEQNITFYRTYGGGAKVDGSFVTTTPAGNRINAKINTALVPEWKNSRQYEAVIEVPKGTTINIGRVEKQYTKTGALLEGNGDQILLPQGWSSEWIKEIREVPSR